MKLSSPKITSSRFSLHSGKYAIKSIPHIQFIFTDDRFRYMETTFAFRLDASLSLLLKVNETKLIEEIANGKVFCFK